ncbi:two-component system sensor histidine kinase/response regulator, partial [Klebsiella pneumoniae]
MKYLASFHTTLKVSRYLFRALAVLLWLLIAFVSVFYIVNALHEREAEIHQELNLNADQAQRYIQRTADVMKELKYVAGNRLSAGDAVAQGQNGDMAVPNFEPLYPDSDCSAMSATWRNSLQSLAWFMRYWRENFFSASALYPLLLLGSGKLFLSHFWLRGGARVR